MRVVGDRFLELSRTNLRTLLVKLDGHPPGSACTIGGHADADGWWVKAVEDAEHYADRPRGEMHPDTEATSILDTTPDEGHTFRIVVQSRMSSTVVGDEHHTDSDHFGPGMLLDVRAWDLPSALRKAADFPLDAWDVDD